MRRITTVAVAESAAHARRAIEHSARLQDAKRDEKAERAKKKNFTWKEKEKRKRDAGMQSSCALRPHLSPAVYAFRCLPGLVKLCRLQCVCLASACAFCGMPAIWATLISGLPRTRKVTLLVPMMTKHGMMWCS